MSRPHDTVKRIETALELGFPLSEAIHTVLGRPLAHFARAHGHRESEVSMCLGGYPGRVYGELRDDLSAELGIERRALDSLITRSRALRRSSASRGTSEVESTTSDPARSAGS